MAPAVASSRCHVVSDNAVTLAGFARGLSANYGVNERFCASFNVCQSQPIPSYIPSAVNPADPLTRDFIPFPLSMTTSCYNPATVEHTQCARRGGGRAIRRRLESASLLLGVSWLVWREERCVCPERKHNNKQCPPFSGGLLI